MSELERNVSRDVTALHDLNIMTKTRMEAFEALIFGSRWALLKLLLIQLFSPSRLQQIVDEKHGQLLKEYQEIINAAAKKINSVSVIK